jgi:protease II
MAGGFRLLSILALFIPLAAAFPADDSSFATTPGPGGPPKAKVEVVEDTIHGHKISDPYRWLEKSDSPDTQEYVCGELAYTRSLLDPLPGRDAIQKRLLEMASTRLEGNHPARRCRTAGSKHFQRNGVREL